MELTAAITSSYVYNDCCDIDVDSIAMPDRPLPSAMLSKREAQLWSLFLFLVAAAIALYLNPESFVILLAATLLITIYSAWAKRNTPFSWIFVGLSFGLVPLGVWLALEPAGLLKAGPGLHPAALILAAMIVITDWGFTNCDASRDVAGDKEKGIPTTPATYGIAATAKMVAPFGSSASFSPWPWAFLLISDGSTWPQRLRPEDGFCCKTWTSCAIPRQRGAKSCSTSRPTTAPCSLRP